MAKQTAIGMEQPSAFTRLRDFVQEVRVEMAKVAWPSKAELKQSTTVVLMVLGLFAFITFVYDAIFTRIILGILSLLG